jgi:hypothetical protein
MRCIRILTAWANIAGHNFREPMMDRFLPIKSWPEYIEVKAGQFGGRRKMGAAQIGRKVFFFLDQQWDGQTCSLCVDLMASDGNLFAHCALRL